MLFLLRVRSLASRRCAVFIIIAALSSLSGCASKNAFVTQSMKANLSLEEAHNQILLLNVMRAAYRRPMYFSTITEFNGPIGQGFATGSLGLAFMPYDAAPNITPAIQFTPDRASFKVAPLDNQEFVAGFTTPIKLATFDYFWQQRWPPELLLALMVDHVSVSKVNSGKPKGEPFKVFENYPGSKEKYDEFVHLVHVLASVGCQLKVSTAIEQDPMVGPLLNAANLLKLDQRILAVKEGILLHREDPPGPSETYSLRLARKTSGLVVKPTCLDSLDSAQKRIDDQSSKLYKNMSTFLEQTKELPIQVFSSTEPSTPASRDASKLVGAPQAVGGCDKDCIVLNIGFRSPQSIVYYLGELARTQIFGTEPCISGAITPEDKCEKYAPTIRMRGKEYEILPIAVTNESTTTRGDLGVEYFGKYYSIRTLADKPDRSMQALSLVSLLIGLQKKASDLPTSSTVRLIGQP